MTKQLLTPIETIEMINGWCNDYMADSNVSAQELVMTIQAETQNTLDRHNPYFTVESSHGELHLDCDGNVVWTTPVCCEDCIADIEWFDLEEWRCFHGDDTPEGACFDILDLAGRTADGGTFDASPTHRKQ